MTASSAQVRETLFAVIPELVQKSKDLTDLTLSDLGITVEEGRDILETLIN